MQLETASAAFIFDLAVGAFLSWFARRIHGQRHCCNVRRAHIGDGTHICSRSFRPLEVAACFWTVCRAIRSAMGIVERVSDKGDISSLLRRWPGRYADAFHNWRLRGLGLCKSQMRSISPPSRPSKRASIALGYGRVGFARASAGRGQRAGALYAIGFSIKTRGWLSRWRC